MLEVTLLRTLLNYLARGILLLLCAALFVYALVDFMIPEREERLYLNPVNWWDHTAQSAGTASD